MIKKGAFKMLSERIKRLRSTILSLESINKIIPHQVISYRPDKNKSPIIRQAETVRELFNNVSINHIPGEKIVGNNTTKYSPRPNHLSNEDKEAIKKFPERFSGEVIKELVLKKGINAIIQEIELRLEDKKLEINQKEFLEAALIESRAFLYYVNRHADYFDDLVSQTVNEEEKEYYQELSDLCRKVPANPAASFREALQSVWLTQIATWFDDVSNHSLGRMDQYLYPYYQDDIKSGVLSRDTAKELFFEFWMKFNLGYKLQELSGVKMGLRADDPDSEEIMDKKQYNLFDSRDGFTWLALKCISQTNHTDDGQALDIAGLDKDGNDATNDISWLILEAEDELRTFEPKSVIKYTDKTDKDFMRKAYEVLAGGFGIPAISFHEAGARGLRSYNKFFKEEDILNHCHIGCIELAIPGKSFTDPMNAFMNLPKILLITINNGYYNGKKIGIELKEPHNFNGFVNNFYLQLEYFVKLYTDTMNEAGQFYAHYFSRPMISALVEGCIQKAIPVDNGGSTYWTRAVNCTGFA
jgi:formate C-acetyltransferase